MKYTLILLSVLIIANANAQAQASASAYAGQGQAKAHAQAYANVFQTANPKPEKDQKEEHPKPEEDQKEEHPIPEEDQQEDDPKPEKDQKEKKLVGAFVPVEDIHEYVSDPQNKPVLELARDEAEKLLKCKYRFSRYEEILEQVVAGKNTQVIMKYKNIYLRHHHKAKYVFVQIFQGLGQNVKPKVTKSFIY